MTRRTIAVAVVAVLALSAACNGAGNDATPDELRISAASSLTEAFTELGKRFEADHPGVKVVFNFASSATIAEQIIEGAPTDVVATADETTMAALTKARVVGAASVFARNRLALLVESGNPLGLTGLGDLGRSDVLFVLCNPAAPCGRLGALALSKAGVTAKPASLEENVKAVVSKVVLGEADAGIVYATDALAVSPLADGIVIDEATDPELVARYLMAVTVDVAVPEPAAEWVAFVRSTVGQTILIDKGFTSP